MPNSSCLHLSARGRSRFRLGLPAALALLLWLAPAVQAANFTASLDRTTITLGETATLSLTFEGGGPQSPPAIPAIPNLQIAYVGPASHVSFIQGKVSSTLTHNFEIRPAVAGDFVIPAMSVELAGEKLVSQPLNLKVVEAAAGTDQIAFMRVLLPKTEVYLGETIVAELQIFLRQSVQEIREFQMPALAADGFNVGKPVQGAMRYTGVNEEIWKVVPLSVPLTPVKTGSFTIGPIHTIIGVSVPAQNRRGRDPFENPFGLFQNRLELRRVPVAVEAQTVRALPLPTENRPANFNGAIGEFTMNSSAGPTNVAVGDPITVRVEIAGRGALDALALPEQESWREFTLYPPTSSVETSDPLGLQGKKHFEMIIAPQNSDIRVLPPLSFSFFDPGKKVYRTLLSSPVELVVRPGGETPLPLVSAAARDEDASAARDIVHIKARPGALGQVARPLVEQPWFLALQAVPLFAFASAVLWRKRTETLANNPRLRRRRQVAQLTRDGVETLRRLAADKQSDEFFASLVRLLQEQLGERLDVPASAITEAVIEERLRPRGMPESTLAALHELFQLCNLARYAPIKTSHELAAVIPKFETVVRDLHSSLK